MSIWDDLGSGGEPFYQVDLRGSAGWFAPHNLDDFPMGPFQTRDDALLAQGYARGLLAVEALGLDARLPVPRRLGPKHRERFEALA